MQNFTAIWLLLGIILCLMELVLPTAFVQLLMGISALLVAGLSFLGLSNLLLQVIVWLTLSSFLTIFSRRFFAVRQTKSKILTSTVGETMTEILPGKVGRVLYEGNSWRGRCDDDKLTIPPGQKVYVVAREGTTLIVMPETVLDH